MAITLQITDGTTTFDLVYNSSTQPYYHARKGLLVVSEDTDVLQHRPDDGEPVPIRGNDMDRTVQFTSDVLGASQDEVLNKIAALKRFIDGKDQQALRYWTVGDVNRVDLKIQLENATNYTLNPIKWGHVDDSGAHYVASAQNSGYAIGIQVTLHLTAYGEGAPITLRNDLASSPHFLEDSNADGRADGWNALNSATFSLPTDGIALIGGVAQRVAGSTNDGIQSAGTVVGNGTSIAAYIWVLNLTVSVTVRLINTTDATVTQTKILTSGDSGGVADRSITVGGFTWYRVSVGGTNSTGSDKTFALGAYVTSGTGVAFRVDAAYLQLGTTTTPPAAGWVSTRNIQNRYDPTSTSAATQARINYIDVWDVPGDSDAVTQTVVELGAATRSTIIASRHTDGTILAANVDHWIESDELTTASTSGTWSTSTGTSDNHYQRFTEGGSPGANSRAYIALTGSSARALLKYPRRIFAIARSSSLLSQFVGVVTTAGVNLTDKTKLSTTGTAVQTVNTWELIDLGLLQGTGVFPDSVPTDADQEVSLSVYVQSAPSSSTNDIDAIFIPVPGDEFAVWVGKENTKSSGGEILFNGVTRRVVSEGSGINEDPAGALWYTAPQKMNRYIFAVVGSSGANTLADTMVVSFTIYPRTRHLLGTS